MENPAERAIFSLRESFENILNESNYSLRLARKKTRQSVRLIKSYKSMLFCSMFLESEPFEQKEMTATKITANAELFYGCFHNEISNKKPT